MFAQVDDPHVHSLSVAALLSTLAHAATAVHSEPVASDALHNWPDVQKSSPHKQSEATGSECADICAA